MSKKKRNRRPNPPAAAQTATASSRDATAVDDSSTDEAFDGDDQPDELDTIASAEHAPDDGVEDEPDAPEASGTAVAPAASTPAAGWVPHESGDIRGVLIQIAGGRLLLPNATIAEVLSYAEPDEAESSAHWLLGRMRWRGWQLPLIAFSRLAGIGEEKPGLGSKVIVLKALGGDRRIPYFAILTQGFPRLVTVAREALEIETDGEALPVAIQARVRLNDEPALLPDLLQIEQFLQAEREAA